MDHIDKIHPDLLELVCIYNADSKRENDDDFITLACSYPVRNGEDKRIWYRARENEFLDNEDLIYFFEENYHYSLIKGLKNENK